MCPTNPSNIPKRKKSTAIPNLTHRKSRKRKKSRRLQGLEYHHPSQSVIFLLAKPERRTWTHSKNSTRVADTEGKKWRPMPDVLHIKVVPEIIRTRSETQKTRTDMKTCICFSKVNKLHVHQHPHIHSHRIPSWSVITCRVLPRLDRPKMERRGSGLQGMCGPGRCRLNHSIKILPTKLPVKVSLTFDQM